MTGLMWFPQYAPDGQLAIRHTCEQSDGLRKYGWLKHDGTNFGSQEIVDKDFILTTEFVKRPGGDHGGDWTARISGKEMVSFLGSFDLKRTQVQTLSEILNVSFQYMEKQIMVT